MEASVDQDQKWLVECLTATLDTNREIRSFAEVSLKQASLQPGCLLHLHLPEDPDHFLFSSLFVVCLVMVMVAGNENPSILICFASKTMNAGQITSKLHVIELGAQPATAVYRNRISPDPIFLTAESAANGGFYAINRRGQVLLATVNDATIIPFVSGQLNNLELAVNLAKRANLPGAENLVLRLWFAGSCQYLDDYRCPDANPLIDFDFDENKVPLLTDPTNRRICLCNSLPAAIILCAIFFVGSALVTFNSSEKAPTWQTANYVGTNKSPLLITQSQLCEALDWLKSHYWEPQKNAVPDVRVEIRTRLREAAYYLK